MGNRWLTIILMGSLLGGEAADEIGTHGAYWLPDHTHSELPGSDAGAYRRTITSDSGVTAAAAATGTLELLERFGYVLPIVK